MKFAITDIETTGSYAGANSITEIAIVITDGTKELDRFETLLRPDQPIPYHITQLTGISNEMVAEAPLFDEMADEIEDFLSDCIFVAHNVGFDYSFIKKQFEDRGTKFNPTRLCTVRMTRKIVPGLKSYSLSNLCTHFGVVNKSAHRAMADVEATLEIFHQLLEMDKDDIILSTIKKGNPESWLPNQVNVQEFHDLSESPGVYYFRDSKGKLLYVGMSGNVKKRVRQHFTGKLKSNRRQEFLKDISSIDHVALGSELIARLWEDHEIKHNWPKHNKAQKHPTFQYGVLPYTDQLGYTRWSISKLSKGMRTIKKFSSANYGREWLFATAKEHNIHPALFGLPSLGNLELPGIEDHQNSLDQIEQQLLENNQQWILMENG
ncbi:MAG: exonuclease domain-containing protein, partial [Flavobacteriales bacterium]